MGRPKKEEKKVELHAHTIKKSFDASYPAEAVLMDSRKNRVGVVAFTEHDSEGPFDEEQRANGEDMSLPIYIKDGITCIRAVELSVSCGIFNPPVKFHLLVYGADFSENSPLSRLIKVKKVNNDFVSYSVLYHLSKRLGVTPSQLYIKDFVMEKRKNGSFFNRFDAKSSIEFMDTYDLTGGRSEREMTKILRKVPRPKRLYVDIRDAMKIIHASGGMAVMAHPGRTLANMDPAKREIFIKNLLELGLDGAELIHNGSNKEINDLFIKCMDEHYTVNEYVVTGGGDVHHKGDKCTIGQANGNDITMKDVEVFLKELYKLQYERKHGLRSHRVYPEVSDIEIESLIDKYETLGATFRQEWIDEVARNDTQLLAETSDQNKPKK